MQKTKAPTRIAYANLTRGMTVRSHLQRGYATLGIAVILLLILSLMSIYLSKSGIADIRTSANKARYAQALANAEQNLEVGLGWLSRSANRATLSPTSWLDCNNLSVSAKAKMLGTDWKCSQMTMNFTTINPGGTTSAATANVVIATPTLLDALGRTFKVIAQGTSTDGSANAVVQQGVFFYAPAGNQSNTPPLMGAGNVPLSGNFTVVGNPNGAGQGVPVSIWSKAVITVPQGSAATCQLGEYLMAGNNCSGNAIISSSAGLGRDVVSNDPTFPSDVFAYVFGVPSVDYGLVKNQATIVADCNNLTVLKGIVWVTGPCAIPSGTVVGSDTQPLQLVVEAGDFEMSANSTFYGMLVAFGLPPSYNAGAIKANGGAKFYGSMISNDPTSMGLQINGTFDMVYHPDLMNVISSPTSTEFKSMARIPGSWADYLP